MRRAPCKIAELDRGEGVLILADVYGATPCNTVCKLMRTAASKRSSGVNLPMLLKALTYRNEALETLDRAASRRPGRHFPHPLRSLRCLSATSKSSTSWAARARLGETDPDRREIPVRSLAGAQWSPRQRQEHHGRDDARRRQGHQIHDGNRRSGRGRRDAMVALIEDKFGEGE
jgi:hypothetical protein